MALLAVIADSHFDETSRFDECVRLHDWIADDLAERGVDLVLHCGDVLERRSTVRERAAIAAWLRKVGKCAPIVIVRGNHDPVGDLAIFAKLRTQNPIVVEEAAAVHAMKGVAVACLAWPRKAELLARHPGLDPADAMRAVLGGLGAEAVDSNGAALPVVLLAHAMVRGSVTSTGQPLVGADLEIGLEDFALVKADAYALGHIHKGQAWDIAGAPCFYPGSPRRTAFGEVESKGYTLLTVGARGEPVHVEHVEVPATRMVHVEATWTAFGFTGGDRCAAEQEGAEVRLRYRVDADRRDAARADAEAWAAELRQLGAASVKIEEVVIATTRTRTPAIAAARTLPEKLTAHWEAKGVALADERRARVLEKVVGLEKAS